MPFVRKSYLCIIQSERAQKKKRYEVWLWTSFNLMQNTLRFCLPFSLFIFFISRHVLMKWKLCAMLAISHPWSHISPRTDMKAISCLNEYVLKDIFIYPSNTIWNVILLPGVDEEIISTSLPPYCCLSIHWWCSVSFSLIFHHYTYWETKSYIWFGFHGSSWWGVNTARDGYERTSCLRVNGECVWERQTDSVLVGIDGEVWAWSN